MPKRQRTIVILSVILATTVSLAPGVWADTLRLTDQQEFKPVSDEPTSKFLLAVAEAKNLVNMGQAEAARKAYEQLKKDFPQIAGPDLDAFVDAEMLYCQGKFAGAMRSYDKFLEKYPLSQLYDASLDRQYAIGTAYLGGQHKVVLKVIKLAGYAEGIRIMEKVTERAGYYSPIGIKAAVAIAQNYEQREKFEEAYLKWREISTRWLVGKYGRDSLLGMARSQRAAFNRQPENKRAFYDTSRLVSAKSYYQKFQLLYPKDAQELKISDIVRQIDEQLAFKQYTIASYYHGVGNMKGANLYYDMVIRDWPGTRAATLAKQERIKNIASKPTSKG